MDSERVRPVNPDILPTFPDNWFTDSFGTFYPLVYAHRSDAAAAEEARFALEVAASDLSLPLLDCGCGMGRHLRWLSRSVRAAVGLDFSIPLLRAARQKLGAAVPLVRSDMRDLPFTDHTFGCVCSFFTSFGYFSDEDNDRVVSEWARVLKPGGALFVDYLNTARIRRDLRPETRRMIEQWTVEELRWIDERTKRVNKRIRITDSNGLSQDFYESVRLYDPEELITLLADRQLETLKSFGAFDGRSWTPDTDRLILVARRKAD